MNSLQGKSPWSESISPVGTTPKIGKISPLSCSVGFTKAIMEDWQEHCDIDSADKFELALRFNILREIPGGFDPENHEDNYGEAEPGDPWYEANFS